MHSGCNTLFEDSVFNIFPSRKSQGLGLRWMMQLPELRYQGQAKADEARDILAFGHVPQRLQEWQKILNGFQFRTTICDTWVSLASELTKSPKKYPVSCLMEKLNQTKPDSSWRRLKKFRRPCDQIFYCLHSQ